MRSFCKNTATIVAACTVVFSLACGDSTGPEGEAQDFSGSYTLVSFSLGTAASVNAVPGATGTFTITATTYAASTTIAGNVVNDHGTYTAQGTSESGTWSQQSTDDEDLQYQGTYTWNAATSQLTLDTTAAGGVRTVLVLQKT